MTGTPTSTDAQQRDNSPDLEDAVVAAGGATVSQQMKLHLEGCPCLGNAVEVREPTEGERRSRDWCETCAVGTTQEPTFDAYNALANADADDVDRGDGIETDGGHEPPTVVDRLEEASKQLRLARDQADRKWDEAAIATSSRHVDETLHAVRTLHERDPVDRGDGIETDGGVDPVSVPPEFDEFPREARRFVLCQANDAADIRVAVNNRVGLSNDDLEADRAGSFTKWELAAVLLALGGPDR